MKKIYLLLFFLFCVCTYSQTMTEKYNSILNRYEYFDSLGNLTGYKVYDSLFKEWKYYQVEVQSYERKPIQYAKPQTDDNFALLQQVANQKQNSYSINHNKIKDYLSTIYANMAFIENIEVRSKVQDRFNSEVLNVINNKGYDYSSSSLTNQVIDFIYKKYIAIESSETRKYSNEIENRNKTIETTASQSNLPLVLNEGKLRSDANPMADVIKYIPSGKTVKVLGIKGDYFKVFYDGKTGYLNETYLHKPYNISILSENNNKNSSQPLSSVNNSDKETYTVIEGKLRSDANPMADVIKYIPSGKTVKVLGRKGDYFKVFYDGKTGYLNEMYLHIPTAYH